MNLNGKTTVALGKAGELEVDLDKLAKSEDVIRYVFNYGLKQMLNDVHASEKDADKKLALSQKKLDSLYAGEVAQQRNRGDAVGREMRAMAEADLRAKLKAIGKKVSDYDKSVWSQVVDRQVKQNEEAYRKAAEAKLAIKPETAAASPDDILAMLELGLNGEKLPEADYSQTVDTETGEVVAEKSKDK